ncbi:MAG TPA: PadR family transcriptional regulator [Patescibacteria group bacterium]|nr:PadR family transcriptional regulator [Patescibacteria group bacterium]
MKFSSELIKGSTKNLILAILREEELYGYQIVKTIREKSGKSLEFGEGSIYPALHALKKEKYLASRWAEENGRKRKYYFLTKEGKKALKQQILEWKEFSGAVNKVLRSTGDFY